MRRISEKFFAVAKNSHCAVGSPAQMRIIFRTKFLIFRKKCAVFSPSIRRRKCEIFFANAPKMRRFCEIFFADAKNFSQFRIFRKTGAFWSQCEKFSKSAQGEIFANAPKMRRISEKYFAFAKNFSQNRRILVALRKIGKIGAVRQCCAGANANYFSKIRRYF